MYFLKSEYKRVLSNSELYVTLGTKVFGLSNIFIYSL